MSLNLEMRKTPDVNPGVKNSLRSESCLHGPLCGKISWIQFVSSEVGS